jgi:hypothetical protein
MFFGGYRHLRSECGYERNNDHYQNCISHCHLLGTRGGWQCASCPRVVRRYVNLVLLLRIQMLDQQQLPLAEFLALEPFCTNRVQLLEDPTIEARHA